MSVVIAKFHPMVDYEEMGFESWARFVKARDALDTAKTPDERRKALQAMQSAREEARTFREEDEMHEPRSVYARPSGFNGRSQR